jgi:CBS domain-containing protein
MTIGSICVRNVDLVQQDETAWQAAVRMRQRAVGTLVVVNPERQPIGIITDRDLMERVIAEDRDPRTTLVRTVMTRDPATIGEDESIRAALPLMRLEGCRRLLVVDRAGSLVGLVSLDDLLMLLGDEMAQIGRVVRGETPKGIADEPVLSRWD